MPRALSLHTQALLYASLDEAPAIEQRLVREARAARASAHAPYSRFSVGAALLLDDGSTLRGANQENASYGLAVCAERTAVWGAWNADLAHAIVAIAVCGGPASIPLDPPPRPDAAPISPCGACRQVLIEARARVRERSPHGCIFVLLDSLGGPVLRLDDVEALLPWPFDPAALLGALRPLSAPRHAPPRASATPPSARRCATRSPPSP